MVSTGKKSWLFMIGFPGTGKSTVGRILAARLGLPFFDLDEIIEKKTRASIPVIFHRFGEATFRLRERIELERLLSAKREGVIALGGGAFESKAVRVLAKQNGITIYLSCSMRELYRRLGKGNDRPLLVAPPRRGETARTARLRRMRYLLNKRLANYHRADLILSTTGRTAQQTVTQLQRMLKELV